MTDRFNYAVWDKNTVLQLCNVPWDVSYRDIVNFEDAQARDDYFSSLESDSIMISTLTYIKYNQPVYINVPINTASKYNYIKVVNPLMPVPHEKTDARREYYYFITDMAYESPNSTRVNVQLDAWMTYHQEVELGRCYLERGHYAMQKTPTPPDFFYMPKQDKALEIPEGLDYGAEYWVTSTHHHSFMSNVEGSRLMVVFSMTANMAENFGTLEAPKLNTSKGNIYGQLPSGSEVYAIRGEQFLDLMEYLSDYPWISQTIQVITSFPEQYMRFNGGIVIKGIELYKLSDQAPTDEFIRMWYDPDRFAIDNRYKQLTKMYSWPYCAIEITDNAGQALIYKPNGVSPWRSGDTPETMTNYLTFRSIAAMTPPYCTIAVWPDAYNYKAGGLTPFTARMLNGEELQKQLPQGEFVESALMITNFPQYSIVNNSYLGYMASGARSRAYSYQQADWSYNKAMAGNQLGYNQSNASIDTSLANTQASINASQRLNSVANNTAMLNAGIGMIGTAAGGMAGGLPGVAGAAGAIASSAASTAVNVSANNQTNAINNSLAATTANNSASNSRYIADTNLAYGNFAASGDYAQSIAAINAKVQDAQVLPPSVSGAAGGDALMTAQGFFGFTIKFKRIKDQFVRVLGEYWFRYGYMWQGFVTPPKSLMCCKNFTYWKMQETYLKTANVPETFKQTIRGIFEKGVTVWVDPDKIGVIDVADNEVIR